jgi:D-psicose/D-tagatose/L-ribulose 3-epimerase
MRIAISNIAWDIPEDEEVAALLARHHVDAIDIAPGKYFPEPESAQPGRIDAVGQWWRSRGIEITGMQALLFGTAGLNIFGPPPAREPMLERLAAVCRIAGRLGATRLVFGSPKNRDRAGLTGAQALEQAVTFFRALGAAAAGEGVAICLEPNPPRYGCNFMTTTWEAAQVVRAVDHAAIRLHLDTGTIAINGEDPAAAVALNADIIGHVHASEPDLLPLGDGGAPHEEVARALRAAIPARIVSIEMVATKAEPHLQAIDRALGVARRVYGEEAQTP